MTEQTATPSASKAKQVKARVIFAGTFGAVDQVVTLDATVAQAGVDAGELDTDKAAVAYAESLAKAAA